MENIFDFTREELSQWLENKGVRSFRAGQIFKWLYIRQVDAFGQMTDLSKPMRRMLEENFTIRRLDLEAHEISTDTTEKYLFRLEDGAHIESVLIPEKDHYTLCVSSQVGCAQNCQFCLTAKGGWVRNLSVSEIIGQVRDARFFLMEKGIDPLTLSNLVFMGMGEPLANYNNLIRALDIITDSDYGLKFSNRRVTVSTAGLVPKIIQLGLDTDVNLAVSLNATGDEMRSRLMPVNKRYPLAQLMDACQKFQMKPRNKITFEYILIREMNDTAEDARRLVRLLKLNKIKAKAKVNLIPYNEHGESEFRRPSNEAVSLFLKVLLDAGMTAIVRKSKGDDISAACGQLKARLLG